MFSSRLFHLFRMFNIIRVGVGAMKIEQFSTRVESKTRLKLIFYDAKNQFSNSHAHALLAWKL